MRPKPLAAKEEGPQEALTARLSGCEAQALSGNRLAAGAAMEASSANCEWKVRGETLSNVEIWCYFVLHDMSVIFVEYDHCVGCC